MLLAKKSLLQFLQIVLILAILWTTLFAAKANKLERHITVT